MSAGLSMASVNKIKELANSREYSLALELVEHQDLTKSLNPQFLRLCGEIYIQNGRYEDARRCLIMAHRLGPESKRILFTFVELYLRMGFFELAKTYYDMYMFDIGSFSSDAKLMQYIWKKHEGAPYEELEEYLTSYAHNLDYDWSYELYFLYKKQDKTAEAKTLAELYHASYKDSENSQIIQDIENGETSVDTYYNVYATEEVPDDKAEFEKLREEEKNLLAADELRMHPKEAEITVMYEDSYTPASSEKTIKRLLKKQDKEQERKDKKELKKQKQLAATEEQPQGAEAVQEAEANAEPDKESETSKSEDSKSEEAASDMTEIPEKKGFFRQLFKRKGETEPEKPEETETGKTEPEEPEKTETGKTEPEKPEEAEKPEPEKPEEAEKPEPEKPEKAEKPEPEKPEETETRESELTEDIKRANHTIANQVIVVDEDDDFEAEAETIEELAKKSEPTEPEPEKKKSPFVFQTVELAPEDFEDEYEVDDFSDKPDDEFGEMDISEPKPVEEPAEEIAEEEPIEEITEEEPVEEIVEEEPIEEEPVEEIVEEEPFEEELVEEIVEEEPVEEIVEEEPIEEELVEEIVEEEPFEEELVEEIVEEEPIEEEPVEEIVEEEPIEEEPVEEFIEGEPVEEFVEEESVEEIVEEEPIEEEPVEEIVEEEPIEEEPVEEIVEEEPIEEEPVEEIVEEEPIEEEPVEESLEKPWVAPFTTKPPKKKLDFPVFKSSLFPDYHKEVKVVENNFHEIMEEAQDKMSENMLKEEQMQREAEELLASLGIDLGSVKTSKPVEAQRQPEKKGPSRDELKASLKIDSTKKNLLKRLKEYR